MVEKDIEEVDVNFAVNSNDELIALHEIVELVAGHKDISNMAKSSICTCILEVLNEVGRGIGYALRGSHKEKEMIVKVPMEHIRQLTESGYHFQYKPKNEWLNTSSWESFNEGALIRIITPGGQEPHMLVEDTIECKFVRYEDDHMVIKPQYIQSREWFEDEL